MCKRSDRTVVIARANVGRLCDWWIVVAIPAVLVALTASPSSVSGEWVLERSWGGHGSGPGEFDLGGDVRVAQGVVYVSDVGNHRIQAFNQLGEFLFEWGERGEDEGQFYAPRGLAIDGNDVLYVVDVGNCRVQKFSLQGEFLELWGNCGSGPGGLTHPVQIDIEDGFAYVVTHSQGHVDKFTIRGDFVIEFGAPKLRLSSVAVREDSVWATDHGNMQVAVQFSRDGELIRQWSLIPPGANWANALDLDIDSKGKLFIANERAGTVEVFTPDGRHVEAIPVYDGTFGLDVVNDSELYVVGWYEVHKFIRQPHPVEPRSWGAIKTQYR